MKKKNKYNDLNNYIFNKISDTKTTLAYTIQEKNELDARIYNCTNIDNTLRFNHNLKVLNNNIEYLKGMLKAFEEILSLLIGEDVRKL